MTRTAGARPAFAQERLAWTADGRIAYELKRLWPDGRTHLVMEPVAFLRRLVGIIPPPRRHLVRYSGVFGPASKLRTKLRALVPSDPTQQAGAHCAEPRPPASTASRARRLPWADLLQRVFADDVLQCPCGGRRSIVAIVTDTALARVLLAGLGLATDPVTGTSPAPTRPPLGRRLVGVPGPPIGRRLPALTRMWPPLRTCHRAKRPDPATCPRRLPRPPSRKPA
jgi:hypothetical protein